MRNIEVLFAKLVDKGLVKEDVQVFMIGFLRVEKFAGDIPLECIDMIIADFAKIDLNMFINDDGLFGWFKEKIVTLLADACYYGAKKDCFANEDITRIFFLFQLLHDNTIASNNLRFAN